MSGTEVLHQDFGKHQTDFLTVPFVYRAHSPRWNRKGLVCVWSINQKFVKHKVAPNEGSMRAYGPGLAAPFVRERVASIGLESTFMPKNAWKARRGKGLGH